MNKNLLGILVILISFIFTSCDEMNERVLPSCTGKSGDLLIIADSACYNHETGQAIKDIFPFLLYTTF